MTATTVTPTRSSEQWGASAALMSLKESDFSYRNMMAYALYPPLYLAGPITTFHSFVHNLAHRQEQVGYAEIARGVAKLVIYSLLLEIGLHYIYTYAMSDEGRWPRFVVRSWSDLGLLFCFCFLTSHCAAH
jgi:D-alanyl-lipoteichoic acid acyltransferase DltB (MBOAT superfamily)